MSRIRTVKPDLFRHEDLFDAERETSLPLRLAFISLFTVADREGRFKWRPRSLKTDCLPYDDIDFSRVLDALEARGFIVRYGCEGEVYGAILTFKSHQVINNREAPSLIPEPNENNILTREERVNDASTAPLVQDQGEGEGREGNREDDTSSLRSEGAKAPPVISSSSPASVPDPKADLYRRGKEILGNKSGGVITNLIEAKGSVARARAAIEQASESGDPKEYIGAIIRNRNHKTEQELRDAGEVW